MVGTSNFFIIFYELENQKKIMIEDHFICHYSNSKGNRLKLDKNCSFIEI